MSHIAASRKPYSPRRHGDTEKNKVKGKTGAQGGGGGHGGVRFPRSGESSLRAKISAASNTSLPPRCLHLLPYECQIVLDGLHLTSRTVIDGQRDRAGESRLGQIGRAPWRER